MLKGNMYNTFGVPRCGKENLRISQGYVVQEVGLMTFRIC
jgi:hypothetical protein